MNIENKWQGATSVHPTRLGMDDMDKIPGVLDMVGDGKLGKIPTYQAETESSVHRHVGSPPDSTFSRAVWC